MTRPTPVTCDIFCARRVSARFWISGNGSVGDESPSVRIGASAGLTLLYTGGAGRSFGSRLDAALIAAWTSLAAASIERLRSNWIVTAAVPR